MDHTSPRAATLGTSFLALLWLVISARRFFSSPAKKKQRLFSLALLLTDEEEGASRAIHIPTQSRPLDRAAVLTPLHLAPSTVAAFDGPLTR